MLAQLAGTPSGKFTAPDAGRKYPDRTKQPAADIYVMGALTRMRVPQS